MWIGYFIGEEEAVTGLGVGRVIVWIRECTWCAQTWKGRDSDRSFMGFEFGTNQFPSFLFRGDVPVRSEQIAEKIFRTRGDAKAKIYLYRMLLSTDMRSFKEPV